eukprot:2043959-Rhodomonas_salina.3
MACGRWRRTSWGEWGTRWQLTTASCANCPRARRGSTRSGGFSALGSTCSTKTWSRSRSSSGPATPRMSATRWSEQASCSRPTRSACAPRVAYPYQVQVQCGLCAPGLASAGASVTRRPCVARAGAVLVVRGLGGQFRPARVCWRVCWRVCAGVREHALCLIALVRRLLALLHSLSLSARHPIPLSPQHPVAFSPPHHMYLPSPSLVSLALASPRSGPLTSGPLPPLLPRCFARSVSACALVFTAVRGRVLCVDLLRCVLCIAPRALLSVLLSHSCLPCHVIVEYRKADTFLRCAAAVSHDGMCPDSSTKVCRRGRGSDSDSFSEAVLHCGVCSARTCLCGCLLTQHAPSTQNPPPFLLLPPRLRSRTCSPSLGRINWPSASSSRPRPSPAWSSSSRTSSRNSTA